jgi:hypothetical protein
MFFEHIERLRVLAVLVAFSAVNSGRAIEG